MSNNKNKKVFLVINLSCFGDVLLTNSLCQNIKLTYPDAKVVFLTNKPFIDAAKFQKDVDEVYAFDKKGEHKGFFGLLKFLKSFPYRNKIFASFVIYGNDRGIILSKLLNAKYIVSNTMNILKHLITNPCQANGLVSMQDINGEFLEALTKTNSKILPIRLNIPTDKNELIEKLKQHKKLVALTLVCETDAKNMPIETAIELIDKLNKEGKTPVFLGVGEFSRNYVEKLKQAGCVDYINLVDATSIKELIQVISICDCLISIDTGTLHLGCAINIPVIAIFYQKHMIAKWAPRKELYNSIVISENYSASHILNATNQLLGEVNNV